MDTKNRDIIKKVIIISVIILLLEYLLTSSVGTFYKIILSFYAIKYLKEQNYVAIKIILIMMFLSILLGSFLILKNLI